VKITKLLIPMADKPPKVPAITSCEKGGFLLFIDSSDGACKEKMHPDEVF
jgi:hypothetical protein